MRINLLPWRETRRKRRNHKFYGTLGVCVIIVFLGMQVVHGLLTVFQHTEQKSIAYLEAELKDVNQAIKEIEHLELEKKQLVQKVQIIQMLQQHRFSLVWLLDTVVRIMPAGLLLTELSRKCTSVQLQGVADTNASISELLRNLERMEGILKVKLTEVACHKKQMGLHFKIEFDQLAVGEEPS